MLSAAQRGSSGANRSLEHPWVSGLLHGFKPALEKELETAHPKFTPPVLKIGPREARVRNNAPTVFTLGLKAAFKIIYKLKRQKEMKRKRQKTRTRKEQETGR